ELESFLRSVATKPVMEAVSELAERPSLWVNALRTEGLSESIQDFELVRWRNPKGKILQWSGLQEDDDPSLPPILILDPDADKNRNYSTLKIRWKVRPKELEKGAAQYHVVVKTDMDEELAARDLFHSGREEQECR